MDLPFNIPGFPQAPQGPIAKEIRIIAAQNGYIIHMRIGQMQEEIRIAASLPVLNHILVEYFSNPLPVNDASQSG